ncbi:hypothetical protein [Symbioplanes lichenis]|uniref:hypothetical protein n=1 Tax=Symbioplanes lichenis TaxID=1629072 RepID=UPI002739D384|nr:hypothetical protein [Actinoplanes lichenis]
MTGPFRWDLVTPGQLGTLLAGVESPSLWYLDDLVACAGKVLARSGDGDLVFVGRSLDSMYDLLGGALDGRRLSRLPLSFHRHWRDSLTGAQLDQARRIADSFGLSPYALARRSRPVTFVDVVDSGGTFTDLFTLLRDWIDDEREPWDVIRRKLRFVGVTVRRDTSPKTFRWQQQVSWARQLPSRSVLNVSLDGRVWSYFAGWQEKLTRSYRPEDWLVESSGPQRDEATRLALAEAAALVAHGRSAAGRRALARATDGEPALAEAWLRRLVTDLRLPATRAARDRPPPASRGR